MYLKIIAKKLLGQPNLIKTQVFYVQEVAKVVVIDKDNDFVLTIFEIIPPYFESLNNG